jgi:hypothetical protein
MSISLWAPCPLVPRPNFTRKGSIFSLVEAIFWPPLRMHATLATEWNFGNLGRAARVNHTACMSDHTEQYALGSENGRGPDGYLLRTVHLCMVVINFQFPRHQTGTTVTRYLGERGLLTFLFGTCETAATTSKGLVDVFVIVDKLAY